MEFLTSLLHNSPSASTSSGFSVEAKATAEVGVKMYNALNTAVSVVTPLVVVVAIGLIVYALFSYLHGKATDDGGTKKMSKKQFIGIVVAGVILIILASVFAGVVKGSLLQTDGGGIVRWFNVANETYTLAELKKIAAPAGA